MDCSHVPIYYYSFPILNQITENMIYYNWVSRSPSILVIVYYLGKHSLKGKRLIVCVMLHLTGKRANWTEQSVILFSSDLGRARVFRGISRGMVTINGAFICFLSLFLPASLTLLTEGGFWKFTCRLYSLNGGNILSFLLNSTRRKSTLPESRNPIFLTS